MLVLKEGEKVFMDWIETMLSQYGYLVLLVGLPLDFIALPIPPAQTTITLTGYLSYTGMMTGWLGLLSAYIGSVAGITITYGIGYAAGSALLTRFGPKIGLSEERMEKIRGTYHKYGNKMLFINFFIPGVRQVTGYVVGIMHIPFRTFALYAYPGAAVWVLAFFGIGYIFGEQWQIVFEWVERFIHYILIAAAVLLAVWLLVRRRKGGCKPQE